PEVRLSFDDGYTTTDAPSIRELQTQIDFFGNKGKPWYMALFAEPRDPEKGSMIESNEFDEFKNFYRGRDIVRSRLSALYFMSFVNSSRAAEDLKNYEAKVADWVATHNANTTKLTTITQHSKRGMEMEVARGMKFVLAKIIAGP
ncbi:hypothetical protein TELCIR_19718, partial [Teladorsagia circumcincta]